VRERGVLGVADTYLMEERRTDRFGRYEILAELGRGAMGIVYRARDPKINRVVAVKTISLAGQPPEEELEYRERFFREAEAAGRLSHPGIVTVFDVGEEPETHAPYIVMEFVAGQSLDKLLLSRDDHKVPPEVALQITLELAEALDCAHGQGVVHRDLKPANILVAEDGHVKIADFGVAKLNLASHTTGGSLLGTPAYMSPEQLGGEAVDGRSDLFSLGVVLYTILTGYRPFQGNSVLTVAFKVVNRAPVPATVLDVELPPGLDYIIARAIAKDPSQRYQRGMEMVLDIQALQQGREPWSKAKQPDSARGALRSASDSGRFSFPDPLAATANRPANRRALNARRGAAERMLATIRKSPFAASLLVGGLLIIIFFGVRQDHLIRNQVVSAPAATKTVPPPPVTADMSAPKTTSRPVQKKRQKPVPVGGSYTPPTKASAPTVPLTAAILEIEVDHKFADAQMSIWVDDTLTYTHPLEGLEKKRLVVFRHIQGHEFHAVQIPPGKHLLRVQVTSGAGLSAQTATIDGEFVSGTENMLRIVFNNTGEMKLSLR
jgi:eukaryotic-like serine/threonine-protein kinase